MGKSLTDLARPAAAAALVAALLLAAGAAAAGDAATPPTAPAKPATPVQPAKQAAPAKQATPAQPAKQAAPAKQAPKKVWRAADLARLRETSRASITIAEVPTPQIATTRNERSADPAVVSRLQEVLTESRDALKRLDRERLASVNPFLRGLARDAQGQPTTPRPVAEVDAERDQWASRQAVATATLERLARAANRPVEEFLPPPPETDAKPER